MFTEYKSKVKEAFETVDEYLKRFSYILTAKMLHDATNYQFL